MKMEVKSVRTSPKGLARKRLGTKPHFTMKASPPLFSTKKNRTFRAIKAYVTSGTVLREVSSSPIGNIGFISFHGQVGWMPRLVGGEESRPSNYISISRKAPPLGG